jgi:hypothetical protein
MNPIFNDPLTNPPSTRYLDAYYSYYLSPSSTTTLYFGMNPPIFCFPDGIGNLSFYTTSIVDIVYDSYLLETSLTQVTLTQALAHTSPFAHGSGNILLHYFHTCTHQVPYLVIPSVKWSTIKSFTQPRLHKINHLHLTHSILLHPTLEVNLQWEDNIPLGATFSCRETFYWGKNCMVATSTRLGESHSYKSFYPYYHWHVS